MNKQETIKTRYMQVGKLRKSGMQMRNWVN